MARPFAGQWLVSTADKMFPLGFFCFSSLISDVVKCCRQMPWPSCCLWASALPWLSGEHPCSGCPPHCSAALRAGPSTRYPALGSTCHALAMKLKCSTMRLLQAGLPARHPSMLTYCNIHDWLSSWHALRMNTALPLIQLTADLRRRAGRQTRWGLVIYRRPSMRLPWACAWQSASPWPWEPPSCWHAPRWCRSSPAIGPC